MFNLRLFDSITVPPALPSHNIIFVTCTNLEDGVGDLVNMKDIGRKIKEIITGNGYQLYGIAAIRALGEKYIEQRRAEFTEIFDVFKEVRDEERCLRDFFSSIQPELTQAAGAIIGPYVDEPSIKNYLPKGIHWVEIGEYGFRNFYGKKCMHRASMGFTPPPSINHTPLHNERWNFGIKINRNNLRADRNHPELLLELNAPKFVKSLLGDITLESASNYLQTHEFMIAYPQHRVHTDLFVRTQLYRMMDQNGKLEKPCDFILPKKSVDRLYLSTLFEELNINHFAFITDTETELVGQRDKLEVRIFSPFIASDEDYEKLYFLQPSVSGPSGNSTLSTCIESQSIPQILWFGGMNNYFTETFLTFIKDHLPEGSDSLLYRYFELGSNENVFCDCEHTSKQLALYLKNEQLKTEWQTIRQEIIRHHNFYTALPAIVKGTLALSHDQAWQMPPADFKHALLGCQALQRLIQKNIAARETLLALSVQQLQQLSKPLINYLLLSDCLDLNGALTLTKEQYDDLKVRFTDKYNLKQQAKKDGILTDNDIMALPINELNSRIHQDFASHPLS